MKQFNAIVMVSIMALWAGAARAGTPAAAQEADSAKVRPDSAEVRLQAVDVAAAKVERKADRFVVTVEGNPVAVGKSAFEMLSSLPAVWVDQNSVSINGQQGTTVIVDERVLQMSFDELKSYLSNIKAEDIRTIEVIPIAGAEYEAASSGGIIKITLKRQRNDGIEGSVSLKLAVDRKDGYMVFPSVNFNYKSGKLGAYSSFSFNRTSVGGTSSLANRTVYDNLPDTVDAYVIGRGRNLVGRVMVGAIYDLTEKHSFGVEYSWNGTLDKSRNESTSSLIRPTDRTDNVSRYDERRRFMNMGVTANYLWKIDKQGSLFKVIGSWTVRPSHNENNYYNRFVAWQTADPASVVTGDSLYRNDPTARYDLYRLSADLDYKLSAKHSIKAGVKYNYTLTTSSQNYSDFADPEWVTLESFNFDKRYREHIAALYGIYNGQFGRVGLTTGLRGEYTFTKPRTTQTIDGQTSVYGARKEYFNLFPNINLSYNLDKKGNNSLVANYARTINRPPFWAISPFRWQLSEYQYGEGDPDLKPMLTDDVSLTFVYRKKYSLSAGTAINNDPITQRSFTDPDDPTITVIRSANMKRIVSWYVSLSAPVTLTKWWELMLNANGVKNISTDEDFSLSKAMAQINVTSTVTLPGKVIFETRGFVRSPVAWGTIEGGWNGGLDASLKKTFLNNKLIAAVGADNIFERASIMHLILHGDTFTTRMTNQWGFFTVWGSVRWNFKAGKGAQTKRVDTSDDQAERMNRK